MVRRPSKAPGKMSMPTSPMVALALAILLTEWGFSDDEDEDERDEDAAAPPAALPPAEPPLQPFEEDALCCVCLETLAAPAYPVYSKLPAVAALLVAEFAGEAIMRPPRCEHIMHAACLEAWVDHGGKDCPLCRGFLA